MSTLSPNALRRLVAAGGLALAVSLSMAACDDVDDFNDTGDETVQEDDGLQDDTDDGFQDEGLDDDTDDEGL